VCTREKHNENENIGQVARGHQKKQMVQELPVHST
jgi:hypothetical protein